MMNTETKPDYRASWGKRAAALLVGKKIVNVRYLTEAEQEEMGWFGSPLVLFLDDGTQVFASSDDEGNDAGALFTSDDNLPVIPVIR